MYIVLNTYNQSLPIWCDIIKKEKKNGVVQIAESSLYYILMEITKLELDQVANGEISILEKFVKEGGDLNTPLPAV